MNLQEQVVAAMLVAKDRWRHSQPSSFMHRRVVDVDGEVVDGVCLLCTVYWSTMYYRGVLCYWRTLSYHSTAVL